MKKFTARNVIHTENGQLLSVEVRRNFAKALNLLNSVIAETKKICPDTSIYVDGGGSVCLMTGDTHDEKGLPRQDRIALRGKVYPMGGGDW